MCELKWVARHFDSAMRRFQAPVESRHRDGVFGHQSVSDKGKGREGDDRVREGWSLTGTRVLPTREKEGRATTAIGKDGAYRNQSANDKGKVKGDEDCNRDWYVSRKEFD